MAVTLYSWLDASAPTLSGTAGSLTTLLNSVLVTGYGAKPAAGWSVPSLGGSNPGTGGNANVIAFLQGTGSNGFYLRVNHSGARVGTTHEAAGTPVATVARLRGYEAMTGITDAGTNLFPTVAQQTIGVFVRVSASADTIARPWYVLADQRTVYMFMLTGDLISAAPAWYGWMFGEIFSFKTSDPGRTMIIGRDSETAFVNANEWMDKVDRVTTLSASHYIARDASGAVGAIQTSKNINFGFTGAATTTQTLDGDVAFSNPGDNKIYFSPLRITHTTGGNVLRGRLRGLHTLIHPTTNLSDGDVFQGTGDYAGKTLMALKPTAGGGSFIMETSNTWDTN